MNFEKIFKRKNCLRFEENWEQTQKMEKIPKCLQLAKKKSMTENLRVTECPENCS